MIFLPFSDSHIIPQLKPFLSFLLLSSPTAQKETLSLLQDLGSHQPNHKFELNFLLCHCSQTMAISPYPSPAEAGVLCVILANTAISISIFKGFVRSFLHIIGIHFASWDEFSGESSESAIYRKSPSESYMEDFRTRTPAVRYGSVFRRGCPREECSICLADFKPNSDVNRLSCGHVFHCSCLEKWLKYWNTTCPLCRNYMMPDGVEEEDDSTPM